MVWLGRPLVVGWGYTDGDPYTQFDTSGFARGGNSATEQQQSLSVPVLSTAEVSLFILSS
jgi:hypothetical protein